MPLSTSRLNPVRNSLKVPRDDNRFLCEFSSTCVDAPFEHNHRLFEKTHEDWLKELRGAARHEAIELACAYTHGNPTACFDRYLILGGHQPELFHPGVWFKNFLIASLAEDQGALGMHVVVDHDEAKQDSLRVPKRLAMPVADRIENTLFQESIAIPSGSNRLPRVPWSALSTHNNHNHKVQWQETIQRVEANLSSAGVRQPILASRAPVLLDCLNQTDNYADAFSQFRQHIEHDHGVCNLETALTQICRGRAFGQFVRHCFVTANRLWVIHNQCRIDFRNRNRIRNPAQPVLELQRDGDRIELPFWIYDTNSVWSTGRRRLWITPSGDRVRITDSNDVRTCDIDLVLSTRDSDWDVQWQSLHDRGICIRPRALMTTLYLRCFVADMFVHGIGGGIYDQLTDDIIRAWLRLEPPVYLIATASLHLPMNRELTPPMGLLLEEVDQTLHRMRSAPERFLDLNQSRQHDLHTKHAQLLDRIPQRGQKREWHYQISQIKRSMEHAISEQYRSLRLQKASLTKREQQLAIERSREYSFVLFPEVDITTRLLELSFKAATKLRSQTRQ